MKQFLLDTNICIYYIKGLYELKSKFEDAGPENFLSGIQILPIFPALDIYASEKARLQKSGMVIDDFDLLIAATAVSFGLVMVTNNTNHFDRVKGIKLEDWTIEL